MTSKTAEARAVPHPQAHPRHHARAGQSSVPAEAARAATLVILIHERPGAVDRVVGLLRRRRANMQSLTISRDEQPDITRITAGIIDSDVAVEQLVEQMRKVIDVREASHLPADQTVERVLALIQVANDPQRSGELIELGRRHGASIVDVTESSITLEVTGSTEQIEECIALLQPFGIRAVARTGSAALPRNPEKHGA